MLLLYFADFLDPDHCISVLLRLLHRVKNSSIEFVLFGSKPSNGRVQFDIQWDDALSIDAPDVSKFLGPHSHGFAHHKDTYP